MFLVGPLFPLSLCHEGGQVPRIIKAFYLNNLPCVQEFRIVMIPLVFPVLFLWLIVMFGALGVFSCVKGLGICFVAHNAMNMGKRGHIMAIIV